MFNYSRKIKFSFLVTMTINLMQKMTSWMLKKGNNRTVISKMSKALIRIKETQL